jgi:prepilin-type processing-associated H-X9-DG protein
MNSFFNFDDDARDHQWRGRRRVTSLERDASRLLLFSEMSPRRNYLGRPNTSICTVHAGSSGSDTPGPGDDGVLDPEGPDDIMDDIEPYESIGYIHPMSGEYYAHVVFADGHVEAFTLLKNISGAIVTNLTQRLCAGEF